MEPKQILQLLADVAVLASRHFNDAAPPAGEQKAQSDSSGRPRSSTLADVIAELETATKDALHEVVLALAAHAEARRQTERDLASATEALVAERAMIDRLRAELAEIRRGVEAAQGLANEALAAERATSERLRAEIVELQRTLEVAQERGDAAGEDENVGAATTTRGDGIEAEIEIDFIQMMLGATVQLREIDGESNVIDVDVPPGIVDGTTLILPSRGGAGEPAGDVLARVRVLPHPTLARDGNDVVMRIPLSTEAIAHKAMMVDTPGGSVMVPLAVKNFQETFRFGGKGIAWKDQPAGDLLITLDTSPLLDAPIDTFPSAAAAFEVLESLSPPARAHLTNLVSSAWDSADARDVREVLWALAVAHERGLRAPLRGFAAQIISDLVKRGLLSNAPPHAGRRSHVLTWLGARSPLFMRERSIGSSLLIWTVHLERLADASQWSHVGAQARFTH